MPYIYKITNIINEKIYVGQTVETIQERWNKHWQDAYAHRTDTIFARAIRKYGKENFIQEEIEFVEKEDDLNDKEIFWIAELHATIKDGNYNTSDGGSNSNTYKYKTEEEMNIIKDKIRKTKLGGKNPNSTSIDVKDFINNKEYHFNSMSECIEYFNFPNKDLITHRCSGKTTCLYKKQYFFKYSNEPEYKFKTIEKFSNRATHCIASNLDGSDKKEFNSIRDAFRYFGIGAEVKISHYKKNKEKIFSCKKYNKKIKITVI